MIKVTFGYEQIQGITYIWFSVNGKKITIPSGLTISEANQAIYNFLVCDGGLEPKQRFRLYFIDFGIKNFMSITTASQWIDYSQLAGR